MGKRGDRKPQVGSTVAEARAEKARRKREFGDSMLPGVRRSAEGTRRLADEARRRGDPPEEIAIRERTARDAEEWYRQACEQYPDSARSLLAQRPEPRPGILARWRRLRRG